MTHESRAVTGDFRVDPYTVLGIDRKATESMIRKAYHDQALKTHPDRVPSARKIQAEEQFKLLTAARDFLLDCDRRAAYDRLYPNLVKISPASPIYNDKSIRTQANDELKRTTNDNLALLSKLRKELRETKRQKPPVTTGDPVVKRPEPPPTYVSAFQTNLSHEEYEKRILAKYGHDR